MSALDVTVQIVPPLFDVDAQVQIEAPTITVVSVLPTGPRGPRGADGTGGGAVDSVNTQTGVVVLTAADVGADASGAAAAALVAAGAYTDSGLATKVATTRQVNGHALSADVTVTKSDVGLGNVDNTSDATKNSAAVTLTNKTLTSPAITTPTGIVKGDVGLGNVDNTADTAKPVSTAQQTALNLKANLASPTFTGTVTIPTGGSITAPTGLVKGDVGLGNVDNTADTAKPVSTAQQTALNLKADLASPTFTGHPVGVTESAGNNSTRLASTAYVDTADALKANLASPTFTGTPAAPTAGAGTNTTQLATTAFVLANGAPSGLSIFGDGSDGSPTFDGSTTILSMAPSSSIYTLVRDLYLASPTINSGVTIITNGFRIFCSGTLTNNGTIQWNGAAGSNAGTGGSGLASTATATMTGSSTPGGAGAAGGVNNGSGSGGLTNSLGGKGGTGGAGGTGSAGTGATPTPPGASTGKPRWSVTASVGQLLNGGSPIVWALMNGGAGGGGGGGDTTNSGGGGGNGGAVVMVCAKIFAGTGAIQSRGGAGGSPTAGNTGGGGGGGGGEVIVISSSISAGAIAGQTIDCTGGTGGTHHGTGAAADGVNGASGTVILLPN